MKVKISEAFKMCDIITNGNCSCRAHGTRPCPSLLPRLREAGGVGEIAAVNDLAQKEKNRRAADQNTFYDYT